MPFSEILRVFEIEIRGRFSIGLDNFPLDKTDDVFYDMAIICNRMVTNRRAMRRDVFQAIADPNRRAILNLLADQKLTLNGVAAHFTISRPAISKHIKILTECGLVVIHQQGRERYCEARPDKLTEVSDWVERYRQLWEHRFDRLGEVLKGMQEEDKKEK